MCRTGSSVFHWTHPGKIWTWDNVSMQMDSTSGDAKIFGLISPEILTALSNGINPING
tara:strand:- start:22 stop:195 length:174 start_codon:yes stop_codon:yes gene_type:complete